MTDRPATPASIASSPEFATAIELRPTPSRWLGGLCSLVHGAAAMAVCIAATRSPLLWAALPLVAMSWALGVDRRGRLRAGAQIQRLVWRTDGSWLLFESGDEWARARLLGHSLIQPSLMVLNFRRMGDGVRRTVVLGRDSESPAALRRLRRRLILNAPSARG